MKKDSFTVLTMEHVSGLCLEDISLSLEPGYLMGLMGRNGSGKTTLIKILLGHTKKKSGKIMIDGVDVDEAPLKTRKKLGFVVDGQPFLANHSVEECGRYFGRFYENHTDTVFQYWLGRMGLSPTGKVGCLSKGENVKLQLALALAHNPRLLLLDEPTGNLDPVFRQEFMYILQDAIARQEISVLLATHLTADLERVADYITLLDKGRLMFSGDLEQLKKQCSAHREQMSLIDCMCRLTGDAQMESREKLIVGGVEDE